MPVAGPAPPCPRCGVPLGKASFSGRQACESAGHGVLLPAHALRGALGVGTLGHLQRAIQQAEPAKLACPSCQSGMREARLPSREGDVAVDGCVSCGAFWFDEGEIERLRKLTAPSTAAGGKRLSGGAEGSGAAAGSSWLDAFFVLDLLSLLGDL